MLADGDILAEVSQEYRESLPNVVSLFENAKTTDDLDRAYSKLTSSYVDPFR